MLIHVLEKYLSIVLYNVDWVIVLSLDMYVLCCSDVEYILCTCHGVVQSGGSNSLPKEWCWW